MNACCTGVSAGTCGNLCWGAYHAGNPSSVVTDLFPMAERGVTHDRVSTPSTNTEHDPHCAKPQPKRGPFNNNSFESTYRSGVSGGASTVQDRSVTGYLTFFGLVC